ncbi:MAG: TfoX/Sxy family protein [Polyangiales bacterium]|nr:TfoX/Sxy family protein [Myxococcales bacterium]
MPHSRELAQRIAALVDGQDGVTQKHMFGGVAFLLRGNMFCGVTNNQLMVRVGPDAYEAALRRPHTTEMTFTGRPLRGFVYVNPAGFRTAPSLASWVRRAMAFVETLPPKRKRRAKPQPAKRQPTQPRSTKSTRRSGATSR